MKLTKQQNIVINCLQNGWVVITGQSMTGAVIASSKFEFRIGSRLFWNLVKLGLLHQDHGYSHGHNWNYILTDLGESIKTKDVQQDILNSVK